MRRSRQVLVLAVVAGCTEAPDPDRIVAFRVVDPLGAAVPGAEVTCRSVDHDIDEGSAIVDGAVTDLGTGVDFECTIPAAAEGSITLRAELGDFSTSMILYQDVRDVVVWQPTVVSDIVGDVVTVSWEPLIDGPVPTWIPSLGFTTPVGTWSVDPGATSFEFPAEGLAGYESMTLWARFEHPEYPGLSRDHDVRVRVSSGPP